jgi:type I restriction enzyme, S subunit
VNKWRGMAMSEWIEKALGDIAETASGGTPDRKNSALFGGNIPWVKSGELEDGFIYNTEENISQEGLKHSAAKLFPMGTVLMAMYGATVGKTAILKIEAATNQAVCAIFPKTELAHTDFVRYALIYQRPEILKLRYGGAQPNISQQVIRNLLLPVPPLAEQRKIAGVLGMVQRAIEQQEKLLQLTAELKKTLLHKLFTEGLRGEPQKQTEIGPVPESWEVARFEDFALLQRGFDLPRSAFKDGPYPVVGATTIIGFHDEGNVRGPGVTVVRSGSSAGKPLFIEADFWAHNVVLFVKDFHGNNPKFVYYMIQILDLTKYREGVAVPTLNRNSFRAIPVAVPERDEQDDVVKMLDSLERKEKVITRKNTILNDLFRTLLHQLMTAQIRVSELELQDIEEVVA